MANTEEPAKHVLTILDKDGKYAPQSIMEINKSAQVGSMAAKKRRAVVHARIRDAVELELKRTSRNS